MEHSTSLHSRLRDRGWYHTGPLARYANNFDLLPPSIQNLAADVGLGPIVTNPFKSILVRGIETLYAVEEALRIVAAYTPPKDPFVALTAKAGIGWGATEAPRGLLYHRYETDENGMILSANIVPPTAQNQPMIESDLHQFVSEHLHLDLDDLELRCEQVIRNYDPCISCSTHFLKLDLESS